MKIMFIEPPKEMWFLMGDYLPPPYGIIQLAAYVEREVKNVEIQVLDCNAEHADWFEMERRIAAFQPDIVASASLATCNTYVTVRTLEIAKKVCPQALTVTGGQHFTATAHDSMKEFPVIDVIVRGEGEETLKELVIKVGEKPTFSKISGISFRNGTQIVHNPPRPLIANLEQLPYPGYHLVKDNVDKYNFALMAGRNARYALIEGSRGCPHECTFCTQWHHWQGKWRLKSSQRIAEEMDFCYNNYGSEFVWLTDDNFGAGTRSDDIAQEIIKRDLGEKITWFVQARCDDIIRNKEALPKLRESGLNWVLLGVENSETETLEAFHKGIEPGDARTAVKLLKNNGIFAHVMLIIGGRTDTVQSIGRQREFAAELDPDLVMFGALTPFPGTQIYEDAKRNGWIEDSNWSHYDMVHAIMPTEALSRAEVQEQLYECYRTFYSPWTKKLGGLFSKNKLKRQVSRRMTGKALLKQFENLLLGAD